MTETTPRGALPAKNVRARALGNALCSTGPRPVIYTDLGPTLAEARTARGLTARALAVAIGAAPSTVTRIERGERRITPVMISSLAAALSPDDPEPIRVLLTSAAGPLLVPDSPGGVRRRERRMQRATTRAERERNRRQRADFMRRSAMQRRAGEMSASAYRLLDDPDADLDRVEVLMEESRRLQAAAGPPIGTFYEQQLIASLKVFGRAATRATGKTPPKRRPARKLLPPPARDGSASEREVLAYIRQQTREELGIEYDD